MKRHVRIGRATRELSTFHGENTDSIPVGRANKINHLTVYADGALVPHREIIRKRCARIAAVIDGRFGLGVSFDSQKTIGQRRVNHDEEAGRSIWFS
jgi:hypothetical protein